MLSHPSNQDWMTYSQKGMNPRKEVRHPDSLPATRLPPREVRPCYFGNHFIINAGVVSADLSRSNSNASIPNDRLQERLARAMAKKNASGAASPLPGKEQTSILAPEEDISAAASVGTESRELSGIGSEEKQTYIRTSTEGLQDQRAEGDLASEGKGGMTETAEDTAESEPLATAAESTPHQDPETTWTSTDDTRSIRAPSGTASQEVLRKSEDLSVTPVAEGSLNMQDELNVYIERIDALQAKLQYLSKEAAESAKQAAASANSSSLEKKIFEKDEKIALLMEEGQKLSKAEMNYLSTVKKMRAQMIANNREQEAAKTRAEKAERSLKAMEDKARKAEAASKWAEQSLATKLAGANELEAVRRERDALHATVADMKAQVSKANSRAEAAENRAQAEQAETARKRIAGLQDDLTSAKIERQLSEEKLQREIKDLQASLEREKEHSRAMESEMLGEQAALESKLESFRVRAEEASSTDHGHVQAKLLRQIETLQSQYATASQNWQGIEGSLLSRITSVEKERDDIAARETDLRKKMRDISLKLKGTEREFDSVQSKHADMDKSLADAEEETQRLTRKATQLEGDLVKALKELEEQKLTSERDLQRKMDEEKAKWTANLQIPRVDSPGTSMRKNSTMGFDINHLMSPVQYERPSSRRSSAMPSFDSNTPPRQQSTTSFRGLANGSMAETPSVVTSMDADDFFGNIPPTPLSTTYQSPRGVNDLISTSTVGAGPSVQLVERMSANVRRLESEKAASKDELLRISTQRDGARQEVVSLMREVEEKRKIEARLESLEREHQGLSQRHQTTLELLGEKSEHVEELKADIADVKQMYRQLADTMK